MPEPVVVSGPMGGTWALSNAGGSWPGSWTSYRGENGFSHFHFVVREPARLWWSTASHVGERLSANPTEPELYSGYILNPGRQG